MASLNIFYFFKFTHNMYKFIYNRIGLKVSGLLYPLQAETALKQVGCSKIKYHVYANMAISY